MQKSHAKKNKSIYYLCREKAKKNNPALKSRDTAAKELMISSESLRDYETGKNNSIPTRIVMEMVELYNAPELRNYYCHNSCPIGKNYVPDIDDKQLDRLTIKLLNSFREITEIKETLIRITADGKIDPGGEKDELEKILDALDVIAKQAQELRVWAEKELIIAKKQDK